MPAERDDTRRRLHEVSFIYLLQTSKGPRLIRRLSQSCNHHYSGPYIMSQFKGNRPIKCPVAGCSHKLTKTAVQVGPTDLCSVDQIQVQSLTSNAAGPRTAEEGRRVDQKTGQESA